MVAGNHAQSQWFKQDPHASRMWTHGGLFQLRSSPPVSFGAERTSYPPSFPVRYLDLMFLVAFLSDSSFCLGFIRDFFESLISGGTL